MKKLILLCLVASVLTACSKDEGGEKKGGKVENQDEQYTFSFTYTGDCGNNLSLFLAGNPFNLVTGENTATYTFETLPLPVPANLNLEDSAPVVEPSHQMASFNITADNIKALTSVDGTYHWVAISNNSHPASRCFRTKK